MQVLEIDSLNVKALFRRAQAYSALMDLDLAEQDLKNALENDPENRSLLLKISKISHNTHTCTVAYVRHHQVGPIL